MNAVQLLAHYERIADARDAVPILRRFILDLAVRGKLVPQDPSEGLGSQVIARATKEKLRLVREQVLRMPRDLGNGSEVSPPFEIPNTWAWTRLDAFGAIVGGGTPPAGDAENFARPGSGVPWLTPADLGGYSELSISHGARDLTEKGLRASSATVMPAGTVLFTSRAPIGYVAIAANPISTNQGFKSIVPYIAECSRYIALVMKCFASDIDARAPGTTFKEVSGKIVAALPFPVAPLAEQRRIVAKVDELLALCDQLESARKEREAKRDRLAVASFARLNAPNPETFTADARFAIDELPSFTTRADQIKQLRETVLRLAVHGILVPQDPNDEPASSFVAKISSKRQLPTESTIGTHAGNAEDEQKNDNPPGWAVVNLEQICDVGTGLTPSKAQPRYHEGGTVPWINSGATSAGLIEAAENFVTENAVVECRLKKYPAGSLVIALYGQGKTRGQVAELGIEATVNQALAVVQWVPGFSQVNRYVLLALKEQYHAMREKAEGGPQPNLNVGKIKKLRVALPPLAEQHRIVAKVDELMALCDQLEASLASAEDTRRRLLDALLHEALAPVAKPSKEHARAAVSGYLVSRLASKRNFGRTAHMKHLYFAESLLGLNLGGRYMREAAGPLDTGIYELEKRAEAAGWYTHSVETLSSGKEKVSYQPGKALKAIAQDGIAILGHTRAEMDRLIDLMGDLKTEPVEIIATLFAAWNDALLDGQTPDDNWIIKEVREHWHVSKQRFTPADLKKWLGWMRQNDVVPLGHAPRTMQQTTMEF